LIFTVGLTDAARKIWSQSEEKCDLDFVGDIGDEGKATALEK
jgi:hypothetical protein